MNVLLIIVGLFFLIKGADFLIDAASNIARKFKISEIGRASCRERVSINV